ncbi:hypothetical protein FLONG3_570 [Fusarium longipes]|uniref:Fumarylacetoacetase n=1 Tax=Fusarium longipes TaxID=694270 RepID=A0A395TB07_9HYPO|nr:hypothetical protein FLONG3_570 [Fusarium longipes]
MKLPMDIGGFTDFMCSLEHVQTVGRLVGYKEVPSNFFHMPLAYNGRASSVIVSGQDISRPQGIISGQDHPKYSTTQKLDFEMEMGVLISQPIPYGQTVSASLARNHIFGFVLLNDWSARDIQFNEMTPLGPFNGKASATSISPWVVTIEALEEAGAVTAVDINNLIGGKNTPNPFLQCRDDISVQVSSYLSRNTGDDRKTENLLSSSDLKHLHWSPFQMLAHQTSSGCGVATGDLIGTGTLSSMQEQMTGDGLDPDHRSGCLHELVEGGTHPFSLSDSSELVWLEDGDIVTMEGWAGSDDNRIGFGKLVSKVVQPSKLL